MRRQAKPEITKWFDALSALSRVEGRTTPIEVEGWFDKLTILSKVEGEYRMTRVQINQNCIALFPSLGTID
jgi:hypothetical protein